MSVDQPPGTDRGDTGLQAYRRAIRAHAKLIAVVLLVTVGASVAWLALRTPKYQATASLLVTALPPDDQTFLGLPFVRESGDPTRTVQTAATLVDSPDAAALLTARLGPPWTRIKLKKAISVAPAGQSNILDVTATGSSKQESVRLANGFVRAALDVRARVVRRSVAATLLSARAQLAAVPDRKSTIAQTLASRVSALQSVASQGNDPTLSVSQLATTPNSPAGTSKVLILLLAVIAGLVLGTGAALLIDLLSPRRIETEAELLSLRQSPVLARIPTIPGNRRFFNRTKGPAPLPPAVKEAMLTLQLQLEFQQGRHEVVMFTSGSGGDGKTQSIVNFAYELAASGRQVIIIDLDLRKPDVAHQLNIEPHRGIEMLIADEVQLEDILVTAPLAPSVRVAPALGTTDHEVLEVLAERFPEAVRQALKLADYVLIDTAPLGEVSDALRFMSSVDDIIIVGRPGNTDSAAFEVMLELLDRGRREATGYVVIGSTSRGARAYGYGYGHQQRRDNAVGERSARPASADQLR